MQAQTAPPGAQRPVSHARAPSAQRSGHNGVAERGSRLQQSGQDAVFPCRGEPERFGKRQVRVPDQYRQWEFLRHVGDSQQQFKPVSSERTTKYLLGFYRRPAGVIAKEYVRPAYYREKQERAAKNAEFRQRQLIERDKLNRFDPITGGDGAPHMAVPRHGRKHLSSTLSRVRRREGEVQLRASSHRFFSQELGPGRRADSQREEGFVTTTRTSSLIGYGRADLPSKGAREVLSEPAYGKAAPALSEQHRQAAAAAVKPPWVE